jgi:hypothetical protein
VNPPERAEAPAAADTGAEPQWREAATAGVIAGLVMTVWKMAETAIAGAGAWRPPNLIATIVLGPSANAGTFDIAALTVGMTLHLLTSIAMGLVYAAIACRLLPRLSAAAELAAIIAYALLTWAVYQWLIMPWLAPTMNANTSAVSLAVAHVSFALGFAGWWIPRTAHPGPAEPSSTER